MVQLRVIKKRLIRCTSIKEHGSLSVIVEDVVEIKTFA